MGYKNPVWNDNAPPSINAGRLNDLCYTVEKLDFADGRVVVGQKEGETLGTNATSEGTNTIASGASSHAEGGQTTASGTASHAEGKCAQEESLATVSGPISAGATTYTVGSAIGEFRVGAAILAQNNGANLTGGAIITAKTETTITVSKSLNPTTAIASSGSINLFATGMAVGEASHSEGQNTTANGDNSHSEGLETVASGEDSHSEGYRTLASGDESHSEGFQTTSGGTAAHSEGFYTVANGIHSHSEGDQTTASGKGAHGEGFRTTAEGDYSHAEGRGTIANGTAQHVFGQYNTPNTTDVEIVGWGTSSTRKNIRTLDQSGNMTIAGTLTQSSDAQLKTVEGEIPDVSEIHAVRFRWNDVNGQHDDLEHVGYIAQDVEKVAPFLVKEDSNGYKALDYIAFLCAKMEMLERRVKELEEKKG